LITMLEGVPGAGKSYHAVAEFLLPWVRAHRRLYLFIDGVYLDRLSAFEGIELASLQKQITVWRSPAEVMQNLPGVDPGSAVIIDECQTVFRAKSKVDPDLLRWLETHRHFGCDIVFMCQNFKQVTSGVTRLVEVCMAFRRMDRFGLKNRYQAKVRGNPEETEVIRQFSGRYSPKVYNYYASYSSASIRESKRAGSILRSPTVILGLCGLIGGGAFFYAGNWISVAAPSAVKGDEPIIASSLPPPPATISEAPSSVRPVRISGAMGYWSKIRNRHEWRYLSEDGKILTVEDIVGLSGGRVRELKDGDSVKLIGDGVVWKPERDVPPNAPRSPVGSSFTPSGQMITGPHFDPPAPAGADPFATPPSPSYTLQ
jgi:zona occludens toxin